MFVTTGVGCTCSPREKKTGCTCSPRKSPYRLPHDAAAPGRPVTLAALVPATWSEVPPAESTLEPCKMDALCFDIDTKPFCRNPFCLISIQNPRGVYPLPLILLNFNELQNAPALPSSVRDLPVRQSGQFSTRGRKPGAGCICSPRKERGTGIGSTCSPRKNMNTYAKCAANPRGMLTSKIIGLKASCNEHLQRQ